MAKNDLYWYQHRINQRMDAIAKNLGTDSPIYQREANKLSEALPNTCVYEVNGVTHLRNVQKLPQVGFTMADLPEVRTWQAVKESYREGYKEMKKEIPDLTLKEYVQQQNRLEEDMPLLYGESEKAQEGLSIMQIRGRKKTWAEINQVRKIQGELL